MAFGSGFEFPHSNYYDDDLRELLEKVKIMLDEYNMLVTRFSEIETEFTDMKAQFEVLSKKVDDVYNYIDDVIDERISKEIASIRAEIEAFTAYVNAKLSAFDDAIEATNKYILVVEEQSANYTNAKVEELKLEMLISFNELSERLASEIDRLQKEIEAIGALDVYDPMKGYRVKFEEALIDVFYGLGRIHGLTDAQYAALRLTNDEYAEKHLTNNEYYLRAELRLIDHEKKYSSITGKLEDVSNIDSWQSVTRYGTISNNDYAGLELSNDAYALLNMTNFYYMTQFTG